MRKLLSRWVGVLVAGLLVPAAHAQAPQAQPARPAAAAAVAAEYRIGAGDVLRVTVFQNADLTLETRVTESGVITFPLMGAVKVGGQSVDEA